MLWPAGSYRSSLEQAIDHRCSRQVGVLAIRDAGRMLQLAGRHPISLRFGGSLPVRGPPRRVLLATGVSTLSFSVHVDAAAPSECRAEPPLSDRTVIGGG